MYGRKLSLTMVAEQIGVGRVTAIVGGQAGLTQPCCSLYVRQTMSLHALIKMAL